MKDEIIRRKNLTQVSVAELLDVDQPKISGLLNGKIIGYSIDRLLRFLQALDQDIEITIRQKPKVKRSARVTIRKN